MAKKSAAPAADISEDHHLVARFRQAIQTKDIVTMGQMLELLGTMRAELLMGKPVIDKLASAQSDEPVARTSTKAPRSGPVGAAPIRSLR